MNRIAVLALVHVAVLALATEAVVVSFGTSARDVQLAPLTKFVKGLDKNTTYHGYLRTVFGSQCSVPAHTIVLWQPKRGVPFVAFFAALGLEFSSAADILFPIRLRANIREAALLNATAVLIFSNINSPYFGKKLGSVTFF